MSRDPVRKAVELGMTLEQADEFTKAMWKGIWKEPMEELIERIRSLEETCGLQDQAAQKYQMEMFVAYKIRKALERIDKLLLSLGSCYPRDARAAEMIAEARAEIFVALKAGKP